MKFTALVAALMLSFTTSAAELTGAGSTFVYPLLAKWATVYKNETGVAINYQSIGSGGGIKQIQSKTVAFGATDMPLKTEDLAKDGLVQFPIVNGAIVPVIHVEGLSGSTLKLSGAVLADIFLGKIKKWNDPALVAINKGTKLPDKDITVVRRSDGSGSTFIWTNYLSKVSPEWKEKVGEGSAVKWPTGVGGKGNEGVASYVKQIDGSIGYVEYAYALQNKMATASMQNSAGTFVEPNSETFEAAAAGADWGKAKDYYLILTNAPGKKSWPIAGSTFVLMHKVQANAEQGKEALKFFRWAYTKGISMATELHYVPLPASVAKSVEKTWKDNLKSTDGAALAVGL
ncbi:MAG: phosphate ABC transporter substrate-binding protein PstS [Bdellovibrionales bacterium]|nr:phosphate ABC transporter substrate-binding protein PstS [Bdellovibrionales bacterium]